MLKKLWYDPVWSTVIASLIVAGLGSLTYFYNLWPPIWVFLKSVYSFTLLSTEVPNWVLVLWGILSLPGIVLIFLFLHEIFYPKGPKPPNWRSYREDLFFNLKWRWNYADDDFIYPLHTFCPNCDFQIYSRYASSYRGIDHISFECESCGRQLGEYSESTESLEDKVRRSIQQKIRNGTWPVKTSS